MQAAVQESPQHSRTGLGLTCHWIFQTWFYWIWTAIWALWTLWGYFHLQSHRCGLPALPNTSYLCHQLHSSLFFPVWSVSEFPFSSLYVFCAPYPSSSLSPSLSILTILPSSRWLFQLGLSYFFLYLHIYLYIFCACNIVTMYWNWYHHFTQTMARS